MFTETVNFIEGITVAEGTFKTGILEEETFKHTLKASYLPGIDITRLDDEAYFSAALFAVRLQVEGIKQVTPEMIEDLPRADGRALLAATGRLEERRTAFRDAAGAAEDRSAGAPETRVSASGNGEHEPG